MKKLLKVIGLLLTGLLVTTNASAYYVSGGVVYDQNNIQAAGIYTYGGYEGYMGNMNLGLPVNPVIMDPYIGTHVLATDPNDLGNPMTYVGNSAASLPSNGSVAVHWYNFDVDVQSLADARYEWDSGITSFKVDFFLEGSDTSEYHVEFDSAFLLTNGHFIDALFYDFGPGEWFMRIEAKGTETGVNGYRVQLVPIPPAALLFVSALAGFGVIGRKKGSKTLS